jgi:hypothetical protein
MKNRIFIYTAFGGMFVVATFQGFFYGVFGYSSGFNSWSMFVSFLVGAFGWGISYRIAQRLNAFANVPTDWQLDLGRWLLPFLVAVILPGLLGGVIGVLLHGSATLGIVMTVTNVVVTLVVHWTIATRVSREPLTHVCFSALLIWLISLPLTFFVGQSLQFWFASFPFSAFLALIGYLTAQGVKAIRTHSVPL